MIAAFLIGAGVGLLAGAGLGVIVAALVANARIAAADEALDEVEANNRHLQAQCADRIPTRADFDAAEARHRLRSSATSPHQPGMAIYPRYTKED